MRRAPTTAVPVDRPSRTARPRRAAAAVGAGSPTTPAAATTGDDEESCWSLPNIILAAILLALLVFGFGFLGAKASPHDAAHHGGRGSPPKGGAGPSFTLPPGVTESAGGGVGLTSVTGPNGECMCHHHCLEVSCRQMPNSTDPERDLSLLTQSMEFSRCGANACVKSKADKTLCEAPTAGKEAKKCNSKQKYLASKIRKCLTPKLKPPAAFTIERDATSGMFLVCRGDKPLETCRGIDGRSQEEFDLLKASVDYIHAIAEKKASTQKRHIVQFIDFGDTDAFLDARMSALPDVATVVLSANPEQRNVAHMTACLNDVDKSWLTVSAHNFSAASEYAKTSIARNPKDPKSALAGVILRISAPGYEDFLQSELDVTITKSKPYMILSTGGADELAAWLMPHGYIAWSPKHCRLGATEEDVKRIGMGGSRKNQVIWVPKAHQKLIQPQCREACMVPACRDGWRTEYGPCDTTKQVCTSEDLMMDNTGKNARHFDGCMWNVNSAACKLDSQWQRVTRCADPHLPVATFSIVDLRGVLVACRGERQCAGVDLPSYDAMWRLITGFVNQLKDANRLTPEFLSVGAYVGGFGFALARNGIEVHMYEAVPTSRQWLKISKCNSGYTSAHIYDFAIGAVDEECSIAPDSSVLDGNISVTCPAPPLANRSQGDSRFDIIVPFRTLNTVLRQFKFDALTMRDSRPPTQRGYIVHFDDAIDPLPLLQSATDWLGDKEWQPSIFILPDGTAELERVEALLSTYGYSMPAKLRNAPAKVFFSNTKRSGR